MAAIIPRGIQRKSEKGVALIGVGLNDAREEAFVLMVCDGIALGIAFQRAGFTSENTAAPSNLFHLDRIQKRANEILEARRTTNVVTLSEVTDMLHRVFVGAWHKEEYSAAHNAAFSLARLYGHVTDKATVEVIRRPSRDPDAPSEQALSSWVNSLPIIEHDSGDAGSASNAGLGPLSRAPAELLGTPPDNLATVRDSSPTAAVSSPTVASPVFPQSTAISDNPNDINDLDGNVCYGPHSGHAGTAANASASHSQLEKINDINGLAGGRSENGAPARPVTGTPQASGRAELLGERVRGGTPPTPTKNKRVPPKRKQVPAPTGEYPPIEDLF